MPQCPLLLGHRGARALKSVPENSLASFDLALAHGCDGFEFDVRLTTDGEAVIAHDSAVDGVEIATSSAAALPRLPRFHEVLARYRHRAFLDIELKVRGLEKITAYLLRKHLPSRGFVVSSFLPGVLRAVHAEDPNLPLGLICDTKAQLAEWRRLPLAFVIPHQRLALRKLIGEVHGAGVQFLVWTVNHSADMQRLARWGVDGLISDETKRLVRLLRPAEE